MNICNKPRNQYDTAVFQKSIMLKNKLSHGFQISNHANMLMPWISMILNRIKNCKTFNIHACFGHANLEKNTLKSKNNQNQTARNFKIFRGQFLEKIS